MPPSEGKKNSMKTLQKNPCPSNLCGKENKLAIKRKKYFLILSFFYSNTITGN